MFLERNSVDLFQCNRNETYADVIIPWGGDNHVAIDLIVQHIQTKLGQRDFCKIYPNVYVIESTFQIRGMHTLISHWEITTPDFVFYLDQLIQLNNGVLSYGAWSWSSAIRREAVVTPTGTLYKSLTLFFKNYKIFREAITREMVNLLENSKVHCICHLHILI
uniref:Uridine kinase-like protein 2, chloroplastic n=1 Tax=Elaeis guineensis var. tenera TaxID=51953 RepID=A0A8N4ESR0_ELAGV|nr:uridine kinase-like protein 2, chloroplastic [Elaeis guineensis]